MRAKPVGSRSDHNCQKTLLIFASTYSSFVRQPDKHGNFFLRLASVLPAETYWPARIASPAANVGLADDAKAEEQVEGYQRRLRDGGIHTQWPKIIAKLFIGLSLAATSVYSFEHRSDRPPTVA
jgi:hypothetical protein